MNLPLEIWYMIGNYIDDYKTLVSLGSTCRSLRELFNDHNTIIVTKQNTYVRWEIYCEDEDKNHTCDQML